MFEVAAPEIVDVVLRDGGTLRLRLPGPADQDALVEFFARLSDRSRYLRFHGIRRVDGELVVPFLAEEPEVGALVGTLGGRIVALASYARLQKGNTAEMAFAVADEEQRRGIGTRLLEQLAIRARRAGIDRFVADVMAENRPALAVFAGAGFEISQELDHGEVELRFPIGATEALRTRVDERDHAAVVASLRPFFTPGTLAVIGASQRRGSIGGELFRNILAADFAGAVYPVNRGATSVAGVRGYRSIDGNLGSHRPRGRSAFPPRRCWTQLRRRSSPASARYASSRRALRRSGPKVARDRRACSRSFAPTVPVSAGKQSEGNQLR